MTVLKHLFQPLKIGSMEIKNRVLMPAMGINFGYDENGFATNQMTEYIKARAKGGTGMIILPAGTIHPSGIDGISYPALWRDDIVPSLKALTDSVHEYDTKLGIHLYHAGGQSDHDVRVAPSPVPAMAIIRETPRELDIKEIEEFVTLYGKAAKKSKEAGFDFVEIHGSHGYLITEFLSPIFNKRTDRYGGSFENRMRFLLECIDAIKENTGSDFPLGIRYNGDDFTPDGWGLDDARKLAVILEKKGVDYLNITAGIYGTKPLTISSMYEEQGYLVYLAEAVKKEVSIPIGTVGRIKDPVMADRIIKDGRADIVAIGRAHIADPEFANKAEGGRLSDIRPCIACCLGCIESVFKGQEASCVINPEVGREYLLKDQKKAEVSRKVMVVGAGPAGMALARLATMRGHKVRIIEEKGETGGMLRVAAKPPKRTEFLDLIDYYQRELAGLKVEIRLNAELTEDLIDEFQPDVAVVCSGSLPRISEVEGLFDTEMDIHTPVDLLERNTTVGDRVLILGGNHIGLQVADYLVDKGKEVVVINRDKSFALQMAAADRFSLRERLKVPNVTLFGSVNIKNFLPNGVVITIKNEDVVLNGYDDIVISEGMKSIRTPARMFKDKGIEVHIIGDAKGPRTILESQAEADEVARNI